MSLLLLLLLWPLLWPLRPLHAMLCSRWSDHRGLSLRQDGDVIIGGVLHMHNKPPSIQQDFSEAPQYQPCTGLDVQSLRVMYALAFAVDEVNRNESLLPGLKLGYHVLDGCSRYPWALQAALTLVTGGRSSCRYPSSSHPSEGGRPVPLLIGASSSTSAIMLSRTLSPVSVPMISYLASCPCLSDRMKFPNFFRTIPSDVYQARAMAELAVHFHWTWVGAVIANTDYGHLMIQAFREAIEGKGVCLEFVETVQRESISTDSARVALRIQAASARVILVWCWYTDAHRLLLELHKLNVTDRQFLASEAWSTSDSLLQDPRVSAVAQGVVGVAIRSSAIPGFEQYLRNLHPAHRPHDAFLREFWEMEFGCSTGLWNSSLAEHRRGPCRGTESLQGAERPFTAASQLRLEYNIYLAVYAAAHALHSLLSCFHGDDITSSTNGSQCSKTAQQIQPEQLLQHLNRVTVTTPLGHSFHFQGADIPAKYDLVNWQKSVDGTLKLVLVGHVDGLDLYLNESAVEWSSGSSQVPRSMCSEMCPPGSRKASRKGEPLCCFDCILCPQGEISNTSGSPHCERCPSEFWSNDERTACLPRQLDFLAYNETLGFTLTVVSLFGVSVTSAVFVVFLRHRQTPMVRANNSELSFLLLLSLKLCFLCPLVFIGRPAAWSCRLQQAAFGISFVLSVSCLLVKTLVVLAAFRSARPGAEAWMRCFGPGQQRGSVCFFTSVQVIICVVWLALSPPEPYHDTGFQGSKTTVKCSMASVVGFSLVLGYIGLLACSCLLLAFLARKLPNNFNEAKLITFSMLIFCAVWVAFIPAYVSSPGKYVVAVEIFAILASSYGLLLCVFGPKCFIILLRPERNTKKHLMSR